MLADLTPEERLCCILCRPSLTEPLCESARNLAGAKFNWQFFIDLVFRLRIFGIAHHHVASVLADITPREALRHLRARAAANAKRSEAMAKELTVILDLLGSAGIRAVPLKGPVLIERIWGDSRLGVYHDLDILVKAEEARRAAEVLLQQGYRPGHVGFPDLSEWNERRDPLMLLRDHELGFPLLVDLHHTLAEFEWIGRARHAKHLWDHLQSSSFAGTRIWLLPDDWRIALLALHTLQHRFQCLHWVAELYGLTQLCPQVWPEALRRAKEIGARRELVFTRRICDMILGETPTNGRGAPSFVTRMAERPFRPPQLRFEPYRLQLAIRQGMVEKVAYLLTVPFRPTPSDVALVRLPSWLKPAYCILRPIRLVVMHLLFRPFVVIWRRILGRRRPDDDMQQGVEP